MTWTKINTWISIFAFVGIMAVLTMYFGSSLASKPGITLDEDSQEYIANYGGFVRNANLTELSDDETADLRNDPLDSDEDAEKSTITDALASIFYLKTLWAKIERPFKIVANIPTFLLSSLGLPVAAFSVVINVLGYAIFIALILIVKKFISH